MCHVITTSGEHAERARLGDGTFFTCLPSGKCHVHSGQAVQKCASATARNGSTTVAWTAPPTAPASAATAGGGSSGSTAHDDASSLPLEGRKREKKGRARRHAGETARGTKRRARERERRAFERSVGRKGGLQSVKRRARERE